MMICSAIRKLTEWLAIVLAASITFSMVLQIFQRFVMNHSLEWPDEFAGLALVWVTFVGAYLVHAEDGHVRLKWIEERAPHWIGVTVSTIRDTLVGAFLIVLCYYSIIIVDRTWNQTPVTVLISKGLIYTVMPVMSGLMLIETVIRTPLFRFLRRTLKMRLARGSDEPHQPTVAP